MIYIQNPLFSYISIAFFMTSLIALYYDLRAGRYLWAIIDVVIFPIGAIRGAMMFLKLL